MNLSSMAQATLLLTSYFSKASADGAKPLSNTEWGRFALWLKEQSATPADLLVSDPKLLLNSLPASYVSAERIVQLLSRGHSLALAVEKWQRAGLWVVTRSDQEYPKRLKHHLKAYAPPVLFGCGNKALLNAGGLAVVGSRNAGDSDLSFTQQVGMKAALASIPIVSGGARGVDEAAMLGAISSGGYVIGVIADSLLKSATSAKWRKGLMDGNAVLVSPFYPEAGFSVGNAMARNKYIYCLADASLVIHSGKKGGTLNGAEENLKERWVPLWVKPTQDKNAANADLVIQGGRWSEADINNLNLAALFLPDNNASTQVNMTQPDLFLLDAGSEQVAEAALFLSQTRSVKTGLSLFELGLVEKTLIKKPGLAAHTVETEPVDATVDFYKIFVAELRRLTIEPATLNTLIDSTALHKSQINDWLKRAVDEGVVKKLNRPVRYQLNNI